MSQQFKRTPSKQKFQDQLKGFGPAGLFAIGTILLTGTVLLDQIAIPISALLVLLWVRFSHTPWRKIGYIAPVSWGKTLLAGILFGFAFKLLTKAVIMPLLGAGPVNLTYRHLIGNAALLPHAIWAMLVAGWAEETVYRGFLFERLQKIMKQRKGRMFLIVLITALWFGFAHLPMQGLYGALHGFILGLVFGAIYAGKRNLVFLMISHAAYDLLTLALIYWNLEREVSQFFFR